MKSSKRKGNKIMIKGIAEICDKYEGFFAVIAVIAFIIGFIGMAVSVAVALLLSYLPGMKADREITFNNPNT